MAKSTSTLCKNLAEQNISENDGGVEEGFNNSPKTPRKMQRKLQGMRRGISLIAPRPVEQFGPCGRIKENAAMTMTIQDPASQRLTWFSPPLTVLVIKKVQDADVIPPFFKLVQWFIRERGMMVLVEAKVLDDPLVTKNPAFTHIKGKLITFTEGKDDLTDKVDLIVCLGGDGTLLYASSLFQKSVPPVMAFNLGSLGFLTPFKMEDFEHQVTKVLEGHAALTLRSRLRCSIVRKEKTIGGLTNRSSTSTLAVTPSTKKVTIKLNNASINEHSDVSAATVGYSNQRKLTDLLAVNDIVIDRGPSPYLSNIDLFIDGLLITSVQGDGLILSTTTGSTAYAAAAGASMIHPSVSAIMVTPICPHSLSFRPIVVPAGVELKISISPDSRNTAWVSFDGRNPQELIHGDCMRVTMSIYPIPCICAHDQTYDWFASLAECLHWNVRKKQKAMSELPNLSGSTSSSDAEEPLASPASVRRTGNSISLARNTK